MDVIKAIYHRRAVRRFTTSSVDTEALRSLIEAAIHAPSAINLPLWRFVVVHRRETLQ